MRDCTVLDTFYHLHQVHRTSTTMNDIFDWGSDDFLPLDKGGNSSVGIYTYFIKFRIMLNLTGEVEVDYTEMFVDIESEGIPTAEILGHQIDMIDGDLLGAASEHMNMPQDYFTVRHEINSLF